MKRFYKSMLIILCGGLLLSGCFKKMGLKYLAPDGREGYVKQGKKIFYESGNFKQGYHYTELEDVNVKSFEVLTVYDEKREQFIKPNSHYGKDKKSFYCYGYKIGIPEDEVKSMKIVAKESLYKTFGNSIGEELEDNEIKYDYYLQSNSNYYRTEDDGAGEGCSELAEPLPLDYETTEFISESLFKDKNKYILTNRGNETEILEMDYESFSDELARDSGTRYLMDKNNVYAYNRNYLSPSRTLIIEGLDGVLNYRMIDYQYAQLGDRIFKNDEELIVENPDLFISLGNEYHSDKRHIYFRDMRIEIDATTFEMLEGQYARDKDNYYISARKIETDDYKNFKILEDNYATDSNYVYYAGTKIEGISSKDFSKVYDRIFLAGNKVVMDGEVKGEVDAASFVVFEDTYFAKDKENMYYWPRFSKMTLTEDIVIETLEPCSSGYFRDSNGYYELSKEEGKSIIVPITENENDAKSACKHI